MSYLKKLLSTYAKQIHVPPALLQAQPAPEQDPLDAVLLNPANAQALGAVFCIQIERLERSMFRQKQYVKNLYEVCDSERKQEPAMVLAFKNLNEERDILRKQKSLLGLLQKQAKLLKYLAKG
jgi:hypothetical protein